jgi:pimeloyl-ACP methyl ester carboxylesterase
MPVPTPSHQERFVPSEADCHVFYEISGDERGTPLLFSDGLFCEGHVWKYLIPALGDCRCLHWHYPGHGRSGEPSPLAGLAPEQLADDAARVLDDAGIESVVALGHSLGVQVTLELWRRHPDRVRGLVLLCGSPGKLTWTFHESALLGHALPLLDAVTRFLPRQVDRIWRHLPFEASLRLALLTREVNPRLIRNADLAEYLGRLARVDFRVALRMAAAAGRHDATGYLGEIRLPTLVVAGEEDRFTPPKRSRLLADSVPGAQLLLVPGGTHSLPIEMPELVNLTVRRFLERDLVRPGSTS